jgi:hypothetical protein
VTRTARSVGTWAESRVVDFLRANGWPNAERRALSGSLDRGDTTGHPGLVMEVKATSRVFKLGAWLREAEAERRNDNADFGHVIVKPPGMGAKSTNRWFSVMWEESAQELLAKAGEPPTLQPLYGGHSLTLGLWMEVGALDAAKEQVRYWMARIKPLGVHDPERFYNVMYLYQRLELFRLAGYGQPLENQ